MIDHVSIAVADLDASAAFYRVVLAPLGLAQLSVRKDRIGFGKRYPEFWLNAQPEMARVGEACGSHVCLRAPDADAVRAFHGAAIDGGERDDGGPGERRMTATVTFGAFIRDLDGNRIEAVTFPRTPAG